MRSTLTSISPVTLLGWALIWGLATGCSDVNLHHASPIPNRPKAAGQVFTSPDATQVNVGISTLFSRGTLQATQNSAQIAAITLTNDTPLAHSIAADNGSFITGTLGPSESATLNLTQAGDYVYRCRIHLENAAESGIIHVSGPLPAPAPSATLIPGTPTLPTVTIPTPLPPQPLNS